MFFSQNARSKHKKSIQFIKKKMISPILSRVFAIFACVYDDLSSYDEFLMSVQIGRTHNM